MPLDRDAEQVLEMVRLSGRPSYDTLTPPEARALFLAGREVLSPDPPPVAEIRELAAPGPNGGSIPVRLYRGAAAVPGAALPALVFFHGGGWVIGDLDSHDGICRHLANAAGCAVASVHYRLAPEDKFPAAVEDCFAATRWLADSGAVLGINGGRLAVGGDSAGGNLAAVVSLLARDRGAPALRAQLLLYPAADFVAIRESHRRFAEGHLLTMTTMRWFTAHYLRRPEDAADWRASPLRAADLAGVAPAYILTAGFDPLCDEGVAYAERLAECGISVRHRHIADQIHGFLMMGRIVRAAAPALDEIAGVLRERFDG
jgi:acetyl esterase